MLVVCFKKCFERVDGTGTCTGTSNGTGTGNGTRSNNIATALHIPELQNGDVLDFVLLLRTVAGKAGP
jgi:hypothetical protein